MSDASLLPGEAIVAACSEEGADVGAIGADKTAMRVLGSTYGIDFAVIDRRDLQSATLGAQSLSERIGGIDALILLEDADTLTSSSVDGGLASSSINENFAWSVGLLRTFESYLGHATHVDIVFVLTHTRDSAPPKLSGQPESRSSFARWASKFRAGAEDVAALRVSTVGYVHADDENGAAGWKAAGEVRDRLIEPAEEFFVPTQFGPPAR